MKWKEATGIPTSSFNILSTLFMQLHKFREHPYLFPSVEGPNSEETTVLDLGSASGKLAV